jgi:hypothetical protein
MLGVDEIVITTVTPKPGGLEIAVHRVVNGGATREATMLLPAGAPPDRLDGLAPVFAERPGDAPPPVIPAPTTVTAPTRPVPDTVPADPAAGAAPAPVDPPGTSGRRLELAGMVGSAAMATLGVVLWAGASGAQDVACGSSCACDVSCAAVSACDNLACTPSCTGPLRGCVSTGAGCTTCK